MTTSDPSYDFAVGTSFDPNARPGAHAAATGPAASGCPVGGGAGAVRLAGASYQQTPTELYRSLRREHGPVAPVLLDGDVPAWLVLGYSELSYVTTHDELFARDSRRWNQWDSIPPDWPLMPFVGYQPSVLFTEGDEHRRRAGVITEALEGVDQFELARDCSTDRGPADRGLLRQRPDGADAQLRARPADAGRGPDVRYARVGRGHPAAGGRSADLAGRRLKGTTRWPRTGGSGTGCANWSRTSGRPPGRTSPRAW